MSRTDKTRPYWVQMRDPQFPYGVTASHWCNGGRCDLDFPVPVTRRQGWRGCELWARYQHNNKLYGRSNWRRNHPSHDGPARAALRRLRQQWLKVTVEDRQDIDSTTDAPTQRWLWRGWHWD